MEMGVLCFPSMAFDAKGGWVDGLPHKRQGLLGVFKQGGYNRFKTANRLKPLTAYNRF
jgi:hypothetical protein